MKTLSRMVSACAVLAASGMALAADCNCQNGQTAVRTNVGTSTMAATPQRYAYRSGYSSVAPAPAPAPVMTSGSAVPLYSTSRPISGPENQWAFMRARQHMRGW